MKIKVKKVIRDYDQFFKIDKAVLQHEKYDGTMSSDVVRYAFVRADAVGIIAYNSKTDIVYLTEQFRYPAYKSNPQNGWIVEIVAGTIENSDSPEETAVRELEEEIGFRVKKDELVLIRKYYPSPGGSSERIFLYYVDLANTKKQSSGGGLADEMEDIQLIQWPVKKALNKLDNNEIIDGKTIIALYWLRDYLSKK